MRYAFFISLIVYACPLQAEPPAVSTITLNQAIRESLERSPDLMKARLDVEQVSLNEPLLLSELDPQFQSGYNYTDDQSPRAAPFFEGTRSRLESFDIAVVQKTLFGTQARLVWENDRLRNPSVIRTLDPSVESNLYLSLRQPLLRYFWGRPDIARRRRFRSQVAVARERFKARRADLITTVSRVYLDLYMARKRFEIARSAVAEAKRLVAKHQEKKRYGLVEDSDFLQAKASLEIEETEWRLSAADLEKAQNALLTALHRHSSSTVSALAPVLPSQIPSFEGTLEEALGKGLQERGELKAAQAAVQAAESALRTETLDNLPDLSLSGSYGVAGLDQTYSNSWDDLGTFNHPVKSVGLNFMTPFGYRKERLEKKSKKLELEAARQDADRLRQQMIQEIRDAWQNRELRRSRLEARRRLLELQRKKLKAEEINFNRGRSSTDLLVRFQQDINRAELDFARAEVEEILSRIELGRATGTLEEAFRD